MDKPITPKIQTSKPVVEKRFEVTYAELHHDKKILNSIYILLPIGINLNNSQMLCSANPSNSSSFASYIFLCHPILNFDRFACEFRLTQ